MVARLARRDYPTRVENYADNRNSRRQWAVLADEVQVASVIGVGHDFLHLTLTIESLGRLVYCLNKPVQRSDELFQMIIFS